MPNIRLLAAEQRQSCFSTLVLILDSKASRKKGTLQAIVSKGFLSREAGDEAMRMHNALMEEEEKRGKPSRHWRLIGMWKEGSLMRDTKLMGMLKTEEESQD